MAKTIREQCELRLASMKLVRKPYEEDWEEMDRLTGATRNRNLFKSNTQTLSTTRRANTKIHDSKGRRAARIAAYGMQSGLSSSTVPWFSLEPPDPEMANYHDVKLWLYEVQKRIYTFFSRIGIYDTFKLNYLELVNPGHAVGVMLEHAEYGAATHGLIAGESWIEQDDANRVDTMYRRFAMSVSALVKMFGINNVSDAARRCWDKGQLSSLVWVCSAIERNHEADPTKIGVRNKPYRMIYWEEGETDKSKLLREGGADSKPFWAPRWEVIGGSVYSESSPAYDAFPELRELQLSRRNRSRVKDNIAGPPMGVPVGLMGRMPNFNPRSITPMSASDREIFGPIWSAPFQAVEALRIDHEEIERNIDECYFVDLFKAISDREGIQPLNDLEAQLRNDEKYTQLGPIVDRVNTEMLEVAVQRAYVILSNLNAIPKAPKELQGAPLLIKFVSVLAMAQRSSQNTAIERVARFAGFVGESFPEAASRFDAEAAIKEFSTGTGTPPTIIRSDEAVAQIQQQQQQQAQQEQMMQAAPAIRDVAAGAELLSRTQVNPGANPLAALTGGGV